MISVVFGLLASSVLVPFLNGYAQERGAFDHPSATIDALLNALSAFTQNRWFFLTLVIVFGGTLVIWIDYFFRRSGCVSGERASQVATTAHRRSVAQLPLIEARPQSFDVVKQRLPDLRLWRTVTTASISELAAVCAGDDPNLSFFSSAAGPYRRHILDGVREQKIRRVDERKRIQTRAILNDGDPGEWTHIDVPVSDLSEVYVDDVRQYFATKGVITPLFDK